VSTAVVGSFGSWSAKPFAGLVLVAFLSCGMAAQALTARTIYSIARDGALPASGFLRRVDRRGSPHGGILVTAAVASLGLLLGLDSTAIGSLIVFGTAAIYVAFLLVAALLAAALYLTGFRRRDVWVSASSAPRALPSWIWPAKVLASRCTIWSLPPRTWYFSLEGPKIRSWPCPE
jgi:amino acid transporter